eukprot:6325073-Amphidinium_carterae.1
MILWVMIYVDDNISIAHMYVGYKFLVIGYLRRVCPALGRTLGHNSAYDYPFGQYVFRSMGTQDS